MQQNSKTPLLVGLVAVEIVAAALAWRDLGARSDEQIRGTKAIWRAVIVANPGNSLVYWLIGRR
jgi:hypothetical protein